MRTPQPQKARTLKNSQECADTDFALKTSGSRSQTKSTKYFVYAQLHVMMIDVTKYDPSFINGWWLAQTIPAKKFKVTMPRPKLKNIIIVLGGS